MSQIASVRLPYDDPATPREMAIDCHAVGEHLHIPQTRRPSPVTPRAEHPATRWDVPTATASFAGALHLHLN
ncbi:hypothetical protein BJ980_000984 [Nocardioides daedukensis]|uniref:Uncharacterized protein n=1 Tax=Nocardioides daedukensis TaxID=634462 RepID=A0A7Y9UPZ7_9ACTN|nr:hypothetical protein [Nocardioides daedukensis]NYG58061.1 hypothetical protein [Nocardioides daedukensis]